MKTVTRLDNGCRAEILGVYDDKVLLRARWNASAADRKKGFFITETGIAMNIVEVDRNYFDQKYGNVL